ncbi:hypothetical protein BGX28_000120 [Mortierella sp. GBA30]|nr:hypothetical protein BGX28_000120 [Mortierella sp. GBA30]
MSNLSNVDRSPYVDESINTMQLQQHATLPSQSSQSAQQQLQQQPSISDPQQFQIQCQQSFFSQPSGFKGQEDLSYPTTTSIPSNTNGIDGTPGYRVGGVLRPSARVELMPESTPTATAAVPKPPLSKPAFTPVPSSQPAPGSDAKLGGQLDSLKHASESRPPLGPFDPVTAPSQQQQTQQYHQQQEQQQDQSVRLTTGHLETSLRAEPTSGKTSNSIISAVPTSSEASLQSTTSPLLEVQVHDQSHSLVNEAPISGQCALGSNIDNAVGSGADPAAEMMTPALAPAPKIHIASDNVIAAAQANQAAIARGRRRSSLAVLVDKIKSASKSRSRSRSTSLSRRLSRTLSRHSLEEEEELEESVGGPYRDVKLAQQEYVAKLRAEQERLGITRNADGLPIPPPPERQSRRTSVTHILGLDKPLLSR